MTAVIVKLTGAQSSTSSKCGQGQGEIRKQVQLNEDSDWNQRKEVLAGSGQSL